MYKLTEAVSHTTTRLKRHKTPKRKGKSRGGRSADTSRLGTLKRLLRERGPMRHGELIEASGIPRGSIGMYLKPAHGFVKQSDGRWAVSGGEKS